MKGILRFKQEGYECQCLKCGATTRLKEGQHCNEVPCPKCGGEMRRADRPGVGKEQVTKAEGDGNHPASHYLVVEDPKSPTTWHLRYRNMSGDIDPGLVGAAWAATHGGYRGNKYEGPGKSEAIARLKRIYEQMGREPPGA